MARAPAGPEGGAPSRTPSSDNGRKEVKRSSKKSFASSPAASSSSAASDASKKKDPRFCAHADRRFLLEKLLPSQKGGAALKKRREFPPLQKEKKHEKKPPTLESEKGSVAEKARGEKGNGKGISKLSVRASLADSWEHDERFSRIFTDEAFAKGGAIGKVDKFGRSLGTRKLKKNDEDAARSKLKTKLQQRRNTEGKVAEEEREDDQEGEGEEDEERAEETEGEEEEEEGDQEDETAEEEEEEEEEDDSSESETEDEDEEDEGPSVWDKEGEDLVMGEEASRRLAVMGLEWENVTANDILVVFRSFARDFASGAASGSAKKARESGEAQAATLRGSPETIVERVSIYPSDFGLERMKIEAVKGPCIDWESVENKRETSPPEAADDGEDEDENEANDAREEAGEGSEEEAENSELEEEEERDEEKGESDAEEADDATDDDEIKPTDEEELRYNEALRKYQIERSRYYYAVVEFDSVASAKFFYDELDGCDISFALDGLDLRFIPDDLEFPHPPTSVSSLSDKKGEAGRVASEAALLRYEPPPAASTALRHSRVKCTWDETPLERTKLLTKRFTEKELRDLDLKEYLASSSSSEDEEGDCTQGRRWKLTESNLQEYRRQLLGDAADLSSDSEHGESGDELKSRDASLPSSSNVKISFEGDLEDWGSSGDDDDEGDTPAGLTEGDEEAWKAYVERSKKKGKEQRRRQARQFEAARAAADEEDEKEDEEARAEGKQKTEQRRRERGKKFPIFAGADGSQDEASSSEEVSDRALSGPRKGGKQPSHANASTGERNRRDKNDASMKRKIENEEATTAELELLTLGHDEETRRHFDLRHELHSRQSKRKAKKMKRMREEEPAANPSEASSFKIDVDDDRFSRLFSNPEFAIDPTNPNFKKTAATDELLRVKRMRSSKLQFTHLKQKAAAGQDQPSVPSFVSTAGPGKTGKAQKQKGKKGFTLFAKNG
ncbi:UNVERIFIED_CONTAM: NUC153 domain-containing protein [Hammondia hammondi]|eukprot:XP_008882480.1 NUC153 domain-containing protein [Hammondia hammondi]